MFTCVWHIFNFPLQHVAHIRQRNCCWGPKGGASKKSLLVEVAAVVIVVVVDATQLGNFLSTCNSVWHERSMDRVAGVGTLRG